MRLSDDLHFKAYEFAYTEPQPVWTSDTGVMEHRDTQAPVTIEELMVTTLATSDALAKLQ